MSEVDSTSTPRANKYPKPPKPNPEFPLYAHANGRWAKRIRGKIQYFGPWSDPDGALTRYLEQKDALYAGRKPRDASTGVTLKQLCNRFMAAKKARVESGELTQRSWNDYLAACELVLEQYGKNRLVADLDPDDFADLRRKLAKKWSPVTLGNTIQRVRVLFKFAFDDGMIDRPVRYGQQFKRPSRKTIRIERAKKGPKLFAAHEIRTLLNGTLAVGEQGPKFVPGASKQLRAMILLGINCGMGNADCGYLPQSALDLDAGILDFPRPKTGIPRRCVLWPETVATIKDAIAHRPEPKDPADAGLVFITKYGLSWTKNIADSPITKEMRKLLDALQINGHRNFYTLRHTFRTVADEAKDQPAVDYAMGHEVAHMSSVYRERISDERLRAVADHVHAWLFFTADKVQH